MAGDVTEFVLWVLVVVLCDIKQQDSQIKTRQKKILTSAYVIEDQLKTSGKTERTYGQMTWAEKNVQKVSMHIALFKNVFIQIS